VYSDTSILVIRSETYNKGSARFYKLGASPDVEFGKLHLSVLKQGQEFWFKVISEQGQFTAYLRSQDAVFINDSGQLKTAASSSDVGNASYTEAIVPSPPPTGEVLVDVEVKE